MPPILYSACRIQTFRDPKGGGGQDLSCYGFALVMVPVKVMRPQLLISFRLLGRHRAVAIKLL